MPFTESEEGKTHYFGDGCNPPHRCPEGTCQRAYNNVCRVCNLEMIKSCECDTKYCEHYESDFDRFIKSK